MSIRPRTWRRAAVLATGATLLVAGPAAAHPYVDGGEIPVDSLAETTLDLAHGCDSEDDAAGQPTTEVALEVPEWLRVVEAEEPDGWLLELEEDDDGRIVEVVWLDDGGAEPAPTFDLDVVAAGEPGEERHLGVFQACDDRSHRWIGTSDEPADDPAVAVTLVEADPDAPPPPEPEPDAADGDGDEPAGEDATDDAIEPEGDDAGGEDDAVDEDAADGDGDPAEDDPIEVAADADDTGSGLAWLVLAVAIVGLVVAGVLVRRRGLAGGDGA